MDKHGVGCLLVQACIYMKACGVRVSARYKGIRLAITDYSVCECCKLQDEGGVCS